MTIYLYDHATQNYIGVLTTPWVKDKIPAGTLIFYKKVKYIVVDSESGQQPNTFSATVNRV